MISYATVGIEQHKKFGLKCQLSLDLCFLLPCVKEARAQDHHCLARALLQLHLDGAEFAVDDVHHPLDFFWRNRPCSALLPKQVHNVGGELAAGLKRHTFVSTNNKIP